MNFVDNLCPIVDNYLKNVDKPLFSVDNPVETSTFRYVLLGSRRSKFGGREAEKQTSSLARQELITQ